MINISKIKQGDVFSELQFYTVQERYGNRIDLKNTDGILLTVDADYVKKCLSSADQCTELKKVTKTELAQRFLDSPRVAMTVNFNKKLDKKKVSEQVASTYDKLTLGMTLEDFKEKIMSIINLEGEPRTMVGRHYGHTDTNGRVGFTDMTITKGSQYRLVDPRTINYLIVNNIKYITK